jgi:hypothetical protein
VFAPSNLHDGGPYFPPGATEDLIEATTCGHEHEEALGDEVRDALAAVHDSGDELPVALGA